MVLLMYVVTGKNSEPTTTYPTSMDGLNHIDLKRLNKIKQIIILVCHMQYHIGGYIYTMMILVGPLP